MTMMMMVMMIMMTMMIADQAARGTLLILWSYCCPPPVLEAPLVDEVFPEQEQQHRRQECWRRHQRPFLLVRRCFVPLLTSMSNHNNAPFAFVHKQSVFKWEVNWQSTSPHWPFLLSSPSLLSSAQLSQPPWRQFFHLRQERCKTCSRRMLWAIL